MGFLKNKLFLTIISLITILNLCAMESHMESEEETPYPEQNLTKIIIRLLEDVSIDKTSDHKKAICWVCGKNILPNELSKLTCGHSFYHNNCVSKIDPHADCPICLKPQKIFIQTK